MTTNRFICAFILSTVLSLSIAFAFYPNGFFTAEVDYKDLEIYPEYDYHAVKNSHHIEWKIHKKTKINSWKTNNKLYAFLEE